MRSCLGVGISGRGKDVRTGLRRLNSLKVLYTMYENGGGEGAKGE
jgi:hypothetical protein